ncbi:hypothetical protein IAT38_006928 [Cryptococcus sp. DSM 104549]
MIPSSSRCDPRSESEAPPRKRRKQRPQLSCTECRRLKLKCDRVVPCSSCVRRHCTGLCQLAEPDNIVEVLPRSLPELRQRVLELEARLLEGPQGKREESGPSAAGQSNPSCSPPSSLPVHAQGSHPTTTTEPHSSVHPPYPRPAMVPSSSSTSAQSMPSLSLAPLPREHTGIEPARVRLTTEIEPGGGQGLVEGYHEDEEHSYGTLAITKSGSTMYLGRTATSEYLKNQEALGGPESPSLPSRELSISPEPHQTFGSNATGGIPTIDGTHYAFPFTTASRSLSTSRLLSALPPKKDGKVLLDSYNRHFAWHASIAPCEQVEPIFNLAYRYVNHPSGVSGKDVPPQDLALLYIVLAMGSYYNLELPPDDPSIEEYLALSKMCLAKGDFMANNTISGLQTLLIMTHLLLYVDCGKNGDPVWPMWGLTARVSQAMGLHRDGSRWNLPEVECENRRRVFWEGYFIESMTSNNFSRPGSLPLQYVDTVFPKYEANGEDELSHYTQMRFKLCKIVNRVIDHTARVVAPTYAACLEIHEELVAFEREIPFALRCRPVLCALPSVYPDPEVAKQASPPIDKRDFQLTFQQFNIAMNVSETLIFLHRPYYARALHTSVDDPTKSAYGQSYLTAVERCHETIIIATNLFELYPQAAARQWWIWHHSFSAAVCMGTLVLKNPKNVLAPLALSLVDQVVTTYTGVVQARNSINMARNLTWLVQLRQQAHARMDEHMSNNHDTGTSTGTDMSREWGDDHADLLGWRTRLISRAGKGRQEAKSAAREGSGAGVNHSNPGSAKGPLFAPQEPLPLSGSMPEVENILAGASVPYEMTWEEQLSQFWDPVALQDGSALDGDNSVFNWWDLGLGVGGDASGSVMPGGQGR